MSKNKNVKCEKETRRLIEGISDLIKTKGDKYKFKAGKKKDIKKIKKTCPHWIIRKGKAVPTLVEATPGNWTCSICQASFPIRPLTEEEYRDVANQFLSHINQIQFWGVKLGGDKDDTKLFMQLKMMIPRFLKAERNVVKSMKKQQEWEDRRTNSDSLSQFGSYASFSYARK